MPTKTRFEFAGDVQNVQTTMIPRIYGRSYAIEAEVNVPAGGAEGVLCAFADFIGGFALWVDEKSLLNHTYQFLGVDTYKQTSTEPIPTGDVKVKIVGGALAGQTAGLLVKVEELTGDLSKVRLFHTSVARANATWANWSEPGRQRAPEPLGR